MGVSVTVCVGCGQVMLAGEDEAPVLCEECRSPRRVRAEALRLFEPVDVPAGQLALE